MYILDKAIGKYKNTYDTNIDRVLTLNDYFHDIQNSSSRKVSVYRHAIKKYGKNSDEAKEIKLNIPAVTMSGVFNERNDNGLRTEFTNVIVLDLDAQDNPDWQYMFWLKSGSLTPISLQGCYMNYTHPIYLIMQHLTYQDYDMLVMMKTYLLITMCLN